MRIWMICFLLASTILMNSYADGGGLIPNQIGLVQIEKGTIIDFNSELTELISAIGIPIIREGEHAFLGRLFTVYEWPDLTIYILPDSQIILVIEAEGTNYRTINGIQIGNVKEVVRAVYGPPAYERAAWDTYLYSTWEETWYLSINYLDNVVTKIQISRLD